MGAYFVRQENYAFLWAEGLCACLLALLGEMNAVIMLAASYEYWDVNKKHACVSQKSHTFHL